MTVVVCLQRCASATHPAAGACVGLVRAAVVAWCLIAAGGAGAVVEGADGVSLDGEWQYVVGDVDGAPAALGDASLMAVPSNWVHRGLDAEGVVWFFRDVQITAAGRYDVVFEGVDYAAEVYWDNVAVGAHRGYFGAFDVVVGRVKRGHHRLAVRVDSPRETPAAFSLHKTLIKGVLAHHDTRPGGAWSTRGQEQNTGGIWGSVRLRRVHTGVVRDVRVITTSATERAARVDVTAVVAEVRGAEVAVRCRLRGPDGRLLYERVIDIDSRPPAVPVAFHIRLENAALWWPRELGAAPLHRVELDVVRRHHRFGDRVRVDFGVRTITRDAQQRIIVNGKPVFLRGTNYIGSLYFADFTRAQIDADLAMVIAANINAVRVHAHVAPQRFYDAADALGLLVFQDFPLQWGYDDSDTFVAEAERQILEMVVEFGNHPSIINWCAHNESPWSSDWMVWKYPDYNPEQNRTLDRALGAALQAFDRHRPSQANSHPSEHAWFGWYSGAIKDFQKPIINPIITEYGAQALPNKATLETFLTPQQMWPLNKENLATWEYHNFQLRELRDIAHVKLGTSADELITNTQRYQARLTQFAAEALRRQKWQPVGGIFQFMFVEHWPSMSWGVVDYRREPKPGYIALQRAYQPLLAIASAQPKREQLSIVVVNDHHRAFADVRLLTNDGVRLAGQTVGDGWRELARFDVADNDILNVSAGVGPVATGTTLRLRLVSNDGAVLSDNEYSDDYFAP